MGKADPDNHANQLNPNNDAFYQSRGWDGRDDASHTDNADVCGKSWRNVGGWGNDLPASYKPAPTIYNVRYAGEAVQREVNVYLPWALMTCSHEEPYLVVDFTYIHSFQEAAAFKIIKRWEEANRQNFRRFTGIVVRFHGEAEN